MLSKKALCHGMLSIVCGTIVILIIQTIQLFLFPEKLINYCIPSIWTPMNYYSNIRTPTPHGAWMGVTEHVLVFDSPCGARARVTECFLSYYRHFRTSTRLLLSLRSSNGGCQTCTSLWQSLQSSNRRCQTCTSIWWSLRGSNGGRQMCNSFR